MTRFNNGFLIINKPLNWTSNDVVKKIKSLDKSLKIGHGGTLDPLATGILPILFNSATKYFEYFLHLNKIYEAEITFGISTDTYDLEGLILEKNNDINIDSIIKSKSFEGNKPSTTILFDQLTPYNLGKLIALYEHKIFVQGCIWNINSYDQWGVELGKELSNEIYENLNSNKTKNNLDSSTNGLINFYKKTKS